MILKIKWGFIFVASQAIILGFQASWSLKMLCLKIWEKIIIVCVPWGFKPVLYAFAENLWGEMVEYMYLNNLIFQVALIICEMLTMYF